MSPKFAYRYTSRQTPTDVINSRFTLLLQVRIVHHRRLSQPSSAHLLVCACIIYMRTYRRIAVQMVYFVKICAGFIFEMQIGLLHVNLLF